ncbi:alpha/beta hydrolase [Nocardioides zeae]|uniref:Alpha/beta hydrolase n=1 Tax=Nocardioides imazamoxiresistens TaxID=3231893 RepID=A0ABU3PXH8_9ACTN|nr:alpha/beta hydrolase [Nocardioides zeae]MDT9593947.1 alpha/beta hydrolase [Nocardioides zeae]
MSWQMTGVGWLMRATRKRAFEDPEGGQALLDRAKADPTPPARVTTQVLVTTQTVEGATVYRVRRAGLAEPTGPAVVYLHGGAYVNEIVKQHWDFLARLVTSLDPRLGVEVLVPVYGLAPQHHAAQARELVATLLEDLRRQGRPAYLMGDSAGGGLALVAAQAAVAAAAERGDPDAGIVGVTAMAPWVDLTMANPEVDAVEPTDPWLARAALHRVAQSWAGEESVADAAVSPLFGPMEGLPPVEVWVGTRDVTWPDCRLLVDRLRAAGTPVTLHEEPGAIHVYPLLPVPEGRRAAAAIATRLEGALRATV